MTKRQKKWFWNSHRSLKRLRQRIYPIFIRAYARGLETRDSDYPQSGTVNPREYVTPLSGGAPITLVQAGPFPYNRGSIQPSVRSFRSKYDRRVPEMKTKVICGRSPVIGEGKTKTKTNSRVGNHGVILSPTGRSSSLILVALQLIARKIRAKE
jgi:hypothetical protein